MLDQYIRDQLPRYVEEHLQSVHRFKAMYVCPLCGSGTGKNKTPAFSIKRNKWKCFACNQGGDIVDLIQLTEGCSKQEAFNKAESFAGVQKEYISRGSENAAAPKKIKQEEPIMDNAVKVDNSEFINKCQEYLPLSQRAIEFAESRGLTLADLQSMGWGSDPDRYDSIVFVKDNGSYEERSVTEFGVKHYKPVGQGDALMWSDAIYNPEGNDVFVVEGAFDAASIKKFGYQVTALCSTNNFPMLIQLIKEKPTDNTLIIALDNDEAGIKSVNKHKDELTALGVKFYIAEEIWGDCKDANELFVKAPDQFIDRLIKTQFDAMESFDQAKQAYVEENSAVLMIDELLANIKNNKYVPVPTGYENYDKAMGGGIRPVLHIIGAAPSLGKTTYTLQLGDQMAAAGNDVLFFSLEMSRDEVIAKSLSRHSFDISGELDTALSCEDVTNGEGHYFWGDKRRRLFTDSVELFKRHARRNYIFEGQWNTTVKIIRERVEKHVKTLGTRPVVIVDYLQMISHENPRLNDKQVVDQAVLELKRMSRDLEIPVIAVSSFNRDGYTKKATMSCFKESGAIEYGSDVLLGLDLKVDEADEDKLDIDELKNRSVRQMNLRIIKNRSGRTGMTLEYDYLPKVNKFVSIK